AHVPVAATGDLGEGGGGRAGLDPDGAISLTGVVAGDLRVKAGRPWTQAVTAGIESPAVIGALQPPALYSSTAQLHSTVRADVLQGANAVFVIPKKDQRAAGQAHTNGFSTQLTAQQNWVPVIENAHGTLTLGNHSDSIHPLVLASAAKLAWSFRSPI